jgi:mannose-6-phosphate isomerase-like protein (cupin superfamily)
MRIGDKQVTEVATALQERRRGDVAGEQGADRRGRLDQLLHALGGHILGSQRVLPPLASTPRLGWGREGRSRTWDVVKGRGRWWREGRTREARHWRNQARGGQTVNRVYDGVSEAAR